MTSPRRIVIVGAGVFGVAGALELASRGHTVSLVDPGPLPHVDAASTDISKVVRPDYGSDDFYVDLMMRALEGFRAYNVALGETLYHEDGFLLMTRAPMREGGFEHESFVRLGARGLAPSRVDAAALARRFPAWAPSIYVDGYLSTQAGWVESGRLIERLIDRARGDGVRLVEGFAMSSLVTRGARVTGVAAADGRVVDADVVVVAAGAWTPTLLPHLADELWAVGQPVLHFAVDRPELYRAPAFPPWAADIASTGWYGFPANAAGVVKVANHGPGRRMSATSPRVVGDGEEARFRAFLRGTFPALADAPLVKQRLCLYCDTRNGDFWIDHDPAHPGLVVAAGGSGHAFKFAPVLGAIIADVVEEREGPLTRRFARRERCATTTEQARMGAR